MSNSEKVSAGQKAMLGSVVLALFCGVLAIVVLALGIFTSVDQIIRFSTGTVTIFYHIVMFILVLCIYRAFSKHENTAMQALLSALLVTLIVKCLPTFVSGVVNMAFYGIFSAAAIVGAVSLILNIILFATQISINYAHKSTPGRVKLSRVIAIVLIVFQIISAVVLLLTDSAYASVVAVVASCLAEVFTYCVILCIQSKLSGYKAVREENEAAGTWTDEKKAETKQKFFGE